MEFLRRHKRLVLIFLALFLAWQSWKWLSPTERLKSRQKTLLNYLERGGESGFNDLSSQNFTNSWGWSREEISLVVADLRALGNSVEITVESQDISIKDDTGEITCQLKLETSGGYFSKEINKAAAKVTKPWKFRWRKVGWPGDWYLEHMECEDAEVPSDYTPGDALRRLSY